MVRVAGAGVAPQSSWLRSRRWSVDRNPHDLSALSGTFFESQLNSFTSEVGRQLGVYPTDADWEILARPSSTAVFRFSRPGDREVIARRLTALGWARTGTC
jgi:hypothetical protein